MPFSERNLTKEHMETRHLTNGSGSMGHICLEEFFFFSGNISHIKKEAEQNANFKNAGKIIIVVLEIPREAG